MKPPTIANVMNGQRTGGLDLVLAMHRKLFRSADDILDTFPTGYSEATVYPRIRGKGGAEEDE